MLAQLLFVRSLFVDASNRPTESESRGSLVDLVTVFVEIAGMYAVVALPSETPTITSRPHEKPGVCQEKTETRPSSLTPRKYVQMTSLLNRRKHPRWKTDELRFAT